MPLAIVEADGLGYRRGGMRDVMIKRAGVLLLAFMLAACGRDASNPAPPRVTAPIDIPVEASAIAVPISAPLSDLQRLAERKVPRTLVTIDEARPDCASVKVIKQVKISCRLVGQVTRGPIRVGGSGNVLTITMPVAATVSARDVAKVINKTATAAAVVTARVRLVSIGDWQPVVKSEIDYVWTRKPGVDFLGRRITFAGKADPALAKLLRGIEADLPREIAKLQPREKLGEAWAKGFTSISVNAKNPPVWMRVTPQKMQFRNYVIERGQLTLNLGLMANVETFVGPRPEDPVPTPLPPPAVSDIAPANGFKFHLPVVADYAELEPVLEKALGKLAKKPIELPGIGMVEPTFGNVTMYATKDSRLAIGLKLRVATPARWIDARGQVWLTGRPYNEPGSKLVRVRDLRIEGEAKSPSFRLLLAVVQSPAVSAALSEALSQNFSNDFEKLMVKAGKAIADKRLGNFVLSARIDDVKNGVVYPAGQGLYMPVDATGTAALRLSPRKAG
jgi:hypothetical protein